MIKLTVGFVSLFIIQCESSYYGGYGGGSSYGSVIPAAIQSKHTVEYKDYHIKNEPIQPQVIEISPSIVPLFMKFLSRSSSVYVNQNHIGSKGETQHTESKDEPHHLSHVVTRPVIQEIREVITPYRNIIQEIKPVQEEIQTLVAKGEPRGGGYNGGYAGDVDTGAIAQLKSLGEGYVSGGNSYDSGYSGDLDTGSVVSSVNSIGGGYATGDVYSDNSNKGALVSQGYGGGYVDAHSANLDSGAVVSEVQNVVGGHPGGYVNDYSGTYDSGAAVGDIHRSGQSLFQQYSEQAPSKSASLGTLGYMTSTVNGQAYYYLNNQANSYKSA